MRRHLFILIVIVAPVCARSQTAWQSNRHSGPVEFEIPIVHSVPPVSIYLPTEVQTDYLWLDQALRQPKNGALMEGYISQLPFNDTMKFMASVLYKVTDNNPITFHQWGGADILPYPYKLRPGHVASVFYQQYAKVAPDAGASAFLLTADFIDDVRIQDTIIFENLTSHVISSMVMVTSRVLDAIKGKYVLGCGSGTASKFKGSHALGWSRLMDTILAPQACLPFEYSPQWRTALQRDEPNIAQGSSDYNWLQRDSEYIVFLNMVGIRADTLGNAIYTVQPAWGQFGTHAGMYPVQNGKVVDPNDDFAIGAAAGLAVSEWKSRLRNKIHAIETPY